MQENYSRRKFIRNSRAYRGGIICCRLLRKSIRGREKDTVRLGMIAYLRGQSHLEEMLKRNDVEIVAMADPDKGMMAATQNSWHNTTKSAG